jgi:hypothetical protein
MPRGLTDAFAHISGNELMRYLLCHANEHARARHRLYQDALTSFQEMREWMGAASSWETALQKATQSAGGRENAAAPKLHSPERLLAVLVIDYPEVKLKKLVTALQIQWMMAPRWALDVTEGFWKGINAGNVEDVFRRPPRRNPDVELAVDYERVFGADFLRCRQSMPEFLPQWAQHLTLSGEPELDDLGEAGDCTGNGKEDCEGDSNEGCDAKALASPETSLSSVFSERLSSQSRPKTRSPELQSGQPTASALTPCHTASTNAAAGLSGRDS